MQAISSSGHRQQATGILRSARCAAQRTNRAAAAAAATELQLKLHRNRSWSWSWSRASCRSNYTHTARLKADYRPRGMQFASIKLEACPVLASSLPAAVASAAVGQFVIPVPGRTALKCRSSCSAWRWFVDCFCICLCRFSLWLQSTDDGCKRAAAAAAYRTVSRPRPCLTHAPFTFICTDADVLSAVSLLSDKSPPCLIVDGLHLTSQ